MICCNTIVLRLNADRKGLIWDDPVCVAYFFTHENFEFLSGPFANMMFKIISQQHNKIKILLGDFKTTVCSKEYLYRPV